MPVLKKPWEGRLLTFPTPAAILLFRDPGHWGLPLFPALTILSVPVLASTSGATDTTPDLVLCPWLH